MSTIRITLDNCSPIETSDIYFPFVPYGFDPPIPPSSVPIFADYVASLEAKGWPSDSYVVHDSTAAFIDLCETYHGCSYAPVPAYQCMTNTGKAPEAAYGVFFPLFAAFLGLRALKELSRLLLVLAALC